MIRIALALVLVALLYACGVRLEDAELDEGY